jgi:C_GCAxxG_C_C family probable redox protein
MPIHEDPVLEKRYHHAREQAVAAFRAGGAEHRNCAQSIMLFAVAALGLEGRTPDPVEYARYLGGGVARSGLTCGALTGAALALGVRDAGAPETWSARDAEGYAQLQQVLSAFRAEFGDTECARLTGCDLSTREGYRTFVRRGVRDTHCVVMIEWICRRLETLFEPALETKKSLQNKV